MPHENPGWFKLGLVWLVALAIIGTCSNPGLATTPIITQDWETGMNGWSISAEVWEVDTPTVGQPDVHGGIQYAGTEIDGNYANNANTRLISPDIPLTANPQNGEIWLRYWQWFQTPEAGDNGRVQISVENGPWVTIPGTTIYWGSDGWSQNLSNLSAYQNQSVRIAFYFVSEGNGADFGWYIDDVSFTEGALVWDANENFEFEITREDWHGALDWSTTNGCWEIGAPASGPMAAHSGSGCAGTDMRGNYLNNANSRLVSPVVVLDG